MTVFEFRKATKEFLNGMPYQVGAPFRIQFPLEDGPPDVMIQLAVGFAEDLEGE